MSATSKKNVYIWVILANNVDNANSMFQAYVRLKMKTSKSLDRVTPKPK